MYRMCWKFLVKSTVNKIAFSELVQTCSSSGRTSLRIFSGLKTSKYLHDLVPQHTRNILLHFCGRNQETRDFFSYDRALLCDDCMKGVSLWSLFNEATIPALRNMVLQNF